MNRKTQMNSMLITGVILVATLNSVMSLVSVIEDQLQGNWRHCYEMWSPRESN